ncbi:tetratricopeptide repeat protein [Cognatiluteimonas profundi]|uniref:tetratricopeptide repeat protein n=1 Tax=Cognatiluteimonas profundi TaxID=2594501 RepID=UPI00131AD06E|nr:tetratricopeptide repeat protein [Lysobacter profundi]
MNTAPRPRASIALFAIAVLASTVASAQVGRYDAEEVRAHHKQEQAAKGKVAADAKFPNATRISPELEATKSGGKVLAEVVALYQAKQYTPAIEKAEALGSTSSNAYERSFAYQLAATAAADAGDKDKAAADFKLAVDSNGLDNDEHFQVMYNLAVMQYQTQHPAEALATVERLMTETRSQAPEYLGMKASLLAQVHRPDEAARLYEQIYAADPTNTQALMNAAAAYQQGNEPAKATALLAAAQGKGALKDAAQYRALYAGYINDGKPAQARAIIEEGVAKGVIQPSPDLAKAYSVIAQDAYAAGDAATAIAMYGKAAPMAADGLAALNLARVLWNEKRTGEARVAAQLALKKGVSPANAAEANKLAAKPGHK